MTLRPAYSDSETGLPSASGRVNAGAVAPASRRTDTSAPSCGRGSVQASLRDHRQAGRDALARGAQPVDEQSDHAPAVLGPFAGYGHAQVGDGVQQVLSADVGADRSVGRRGVEQRRKGGAELLQEV